MHVRALKLYILQILNIQTYWRIAKRCENHFCLPPDQSEIDCIDCTVLGDECQCFTEEYLNRGYFRVQSCQFREISQQHSSKISRAFFWLSVTNTKVSLPLILGLFFQVTMVM